MAFPCSHSVFIYFRLEGGEGELPHQEGILGCEQFMFVNEPLATHLLVGLLPTLLIGGAIAGHLIHLTEAGAGHPLHPTVGGGHTLLNTVGVDLTLGLAPPTAGHR